MLRPTAVLLLLPLIAWLACRGPGDDDATTPTQPLPTAHTPESVHPGRDQDPTPTPVIMGDARWPVRLADSLQTLMQGYDAIIVGRVGAVALPFDPRPGYLGISPAPAFSLPPDHPKAGQTPSPEELSRPPGRGFTVYEIEVHKSLGPAGPSEGETIFVGQAGGIWEGVEHRIQGNPVLQVGKSYLLSVDLDQSVADAVGQTGYFLGVPFAQFQVDTAGKLHPLDEVWAGLPAVSLLSGLPVDSALAFIESATDQSP